MILDSLKNAYLYYPLHPGFKTAFEFLQNNSLKKMPDGRQEIDGDRVFLTLSSVTGKGKKGVRLEAHRRYIDIQLSLKGKECIGWSALSRCKENDGQFDTEKDCGFWRDKPQSWLVLKPGTFVIFFPEDAHAPLAAKGNSRKAVFKVVV